MQVVAKTNGGALTSRTEIKSNRVLTGFTVIMRRAMSKSWVHSLHLFWASRHHVDWSASKSFKRRKEMFGNFNDNCEKDGDMKRDDIEREATMNESEKTDFGGPRWVYNILSGLLCGSQSGRKISNKTLKPYCVFTTSWGQSTLTWEASKIVLAFTMHALICLKVSTSFTSKWISHSIIN